MDNAILKELLAQESELQLQQFNQDAAWELGLELKRAAKAESAIISFEVYAFEQVLFSHAMAGTVKDHQDWIKRKRQAVMRFGHSSYYLGQYNALKQRDFEAQPHIDPKEYCVHGGSFPIRIKGSGLVGAVTVSGLPQEDDHRLAVAAMRHLLAQQSGR